MFRHPNYYKELRKRNNGHGRANLNGPRVAGARSLPASDQAISKEPATAGKQRSPGPGLKLQAREDSTVNRVAEPQASSAKLTDPQATSDKHQAPRHKRQA